MSARTPFVCPDVFIGRLQPGEGEEVEEEEAEEEEEEEDEDSS